MRSLGTQAIWQRRTTFGAMTLYTLAAADRVRDPDLAVVAGDEALRGRQQVATSPRRVQRRRKPGALTEYRKFSPGETGQSVRLTVGGLRWRGRGLLS